MNPSRWLFGGALVLALLGSPAIGRWLSELTTAQSVAGAAPDAGIQGNLPRAGCSFCEPDHPYLEVLDSFRPVASVLGDGTCYLRAPSDGQPWTRRPAEECFRELFRVWKIREVRP